MKVGRNNPCPCGSGKKYKKCCGAGTDAEKVIPFPETKGFEAEPDSRTRGEGLAGMAGSRLAFGPPPAFGPDGRPLTFMESQGSPNLATEALRELQAAIAGRSFESKAEAEAFARAFFEGSNRGALDDFQGLTPDEMHRIMQGRPEALRDFFSLGRGIADDDLQSMPTLENAYLLLTELEAAPLKATEAGYLPRSFVQAWWERVGPRREPEPGQRELSKPSKEADSWELRESRRLLETADLIKLVGPRFSLTEKGRRIAAARDFDALFESLFAALAWGWDWNEFRSEFQELHPMCRQAFIFDLFLLSRLGREWTPLSSLVDAWLRAFPAIAEELPPESDRWSEVSRTMVGTGLLFWPSRLGLVEERGGWRSFGDGKVEAPHEFRLTPLFDRLIRFRAR